MLDKINYNFVNLYLLITGFMKCPSLINSEKVYAIALEIFEKTNDEQWLEILSLDPNDNENIVKVLRNLSHKEQLDGIDEKKEIKNIIAFLLLEKLTDLPNSSTYGLIELTSFWSKFDYPEFMPHTVQGMGNNLQPNEYYSKDNFEMLKQKNLDWANSIIN